MPKSKPNIVFLFTDDQRFDTIGALNNPAIITPNLDRLVQRGTAFSHAFIPGGTCGAVCMPSRAMLHSGKHLFKLERCGAEIPSDNALVGETLGRAGYDTFGTGKWHNGKKAFNRSFKDGSEIFFGGMMDHWNVPTFDYDPTCEYGNTIPSCVNPSQSKQVVHRGGDHIQPGVHSSELLADAMIDFIERRDGDNPFFAYFSSLAPHDPRTMPEKYLDMYPLENVELPGNFMGGHPFNNGELKIRDETLADFPRDPEAIREHIRDYYAMITHLDEQIGRIIAAVEAKGILDETLFVMSGDNGLAVGRHGLMGKQNCYEHSCRVPLIFAGPGIPRGKVTDANVYLLDVFPTLCDLLDLETPGSVDGVSFLDCLTGDGKGRNQMLLAYKNCQRGLRDDRFKLIDYVVDGKHSMTQLFDVVEDPLELINLAADPAHSERIERMRKDLLEMATKWGDREGDHGKVFWDGMTSA